MLAQMCIFMGAFGAGLAGQFIGDVGEARKQAAVIIADLKRENKIENENFNILASDNSKDEWVDYDPIFEFKNVSFSYDGKN